MAAALSYYSIFVTAPLLVLTLLLGEQLFGEQAAKAAMAEMVLSVLPLGAGGAAEFAQQLVRISTPTAGIALLAGVGALLQYARVLTTSLNVTFNVAGTEPIRRAFIVGPLLLVALLGLLWGTWALRLLAGLARRGDDAGLSGPVELLVGGLAPLILAAAFFALILAVAPRVRLSAREVLVPAATGAALWESARHVLGALVGAQDLYVQIFGPIGGLLALLGWIYLNSAILLLTGQLAWAHAMERRGRGELASDAPRRAGPDGWSRPFEGDNVVNEDQGG